MADIRIIVSDAGSPLMQAVYALRHEVFVLEQRVPPELERDEFDESATHLVALCSDAVVGTVRILMSGQHAKIGRMALRAAARRKGIGSRLMNRAVEVAAQMGACDIALHAQLTARAFYQRLGYREEGDIFEEAGIPHIEMRRTIP